MKVLLMELMKAGSSVRRQSVPVCPGGEAHSYLEERKRISESCAGAVSAKPTIESSLEWSGSEPVSRPETMSLEF